MTPVYLNPQNSSSIPFLELKGDQQHSFQVFGHVHDYDLPSSSNNSCLSYNNSFNSHSSQETISFDYSRHGTHSKVEKLILSHENTSDLVQPWLQNIVEDNGGDSNGYTYEDRNNNNKLSSSKKWKLSKMKIMQKLIEPSSNNKNSAKLNNNKQGDHHLNKQHRHSNGETIRVCSDCHTTTTPLWRSGPQGPKTLCNACGIRQRKARRAAMAAAAAAEGFIHETVIRSPIPSPLMESPQKSANKAIELKAERGFLDQQDKSHTLPIKKRSKIIDAAKNSDHTQNSHSAKKNFGFEDFAISSNNDYFNSNPKRSFPRDEEEGAILLMALSCGLACSS